MYISPPCVRSVDVEEMAIPGFAIEVDDLHKSFGDIQALSGLSFNVKSGEIYGLVGPNGAGKTTTIRIIATLIQPASGSARVFGVDVVRQAQEVRGMISYLPEEAGAYRNLSGREYLGFMAGFYTNEKRRAEEMVEEAALISGLEERLRDKVKTYSKGMNRRLLIARALMVRPRVAILDEPTSGLDVVHSYHIRRIIQEYAEKNNIAILLSSHNMLEVEFLCNRVALVNAGRKIDEGSPSELKAKYRAQNLEEVFMEATRIA